MSELRRQAIVPASTGHFEAQARNVGPKQYAAVIVETADLSKVDRQMVRKVEVLENGIDCFQVRDGLKRPFIADQPRGLFQRFPAAGELWNGHQDVLSAFFHFEGRPAFAGVRSDPSD